MYSVCVCTTVATVCESCCALLCVQIVRQKAFRYRCENENKQLHTHTRTHTLYTDTPSLSLPPTLAIFIKTSPALETKSKKLIPFAFLIIAQLHLKDTRAQRDETSSA